MVICYYFLLSNIVFWLGLFVLVRLIVVLVIVVLFLYIVVVGQILMDVLVEVEGVGVDEKFN